MRNEHAEAIHQAAEIIRKGGIVAFPTETVYGLGADAFNPIAVARIFEVKKRPHFDPLIVHVASQGDLDKLVSRDTLRCQKGNRAILARTFDNRSLKERRGP